MVDDNERGTYTPPTEDHLSYESRRSAARRDQMPITLIASVIVLLVLLLAVVIFYNSGLNTRKVGDVGETLGNYKDGAIEEAKPLTDADLLDPGVAHDAQVSGTAPTFANDTEAPQARDAASAAAPVKPADSAENLLPPAQTVPPVAKPSEPAKTVEPKPEVKAEAPTAKPVEKPVAAAAGGSASVQIGAFSSREIADREFAALASSYGLFVGGTSKVVEKIDRNGSTFYRTSFSGFASKEKARQFCDALKAASKSCFVK
ncbi:MAG: SPOR domain-containing protein [Asticcacaulis sp.]